MSPAKGLTDLLPICIAVLLATVAMVGSALLTQPQWAFPSTVRSVHTQSFPSIADLDRSPFVGYAATGRLGPATAALHSRVEFDSLSIPAIALDTPDVRAALGFDLQQGAWPSNDDQVGVSARLAELYDIDVGANTIVNGQRSTVTAVFEDRNAVHAAAVATTPGYLRRTGQAFGLTIFSRFDVDELDLDESGLDVNADEVRVPWAVTERIRSGPTQSLITQLLLAAAVLGATAVTALAARRWSGQQRQRLQSAIDGLTATALGLLGAAAGWRVSAGLVERTMGRRLHWTSDIATTILCAVIVAAVASIAIHIERGPFGRATSRLGLFAASTLLVMVALAWVAIDPDQLADPFNTHADTTLSDGFAANMLLLGDQANLTEFAGSVDLSDLQQRMIESLPRNGFDVTALTVVAGGGGAAYATAPTTRAATPLGFATPELFAALDCELPTGAAGQLLAWSGLELDPAGYVVLGETVERQSVRTLDCAPLASPLLPDLWATVAAEGSITGGIVVTAQSGPSPDDVLRVGLLSHPTAVTQAQPSATAKVFVQLAVLAAIGVAVPLLWRLAAGRGALRLPALAAILLVGFAALLAWARIVTMSAGFTVPFFGLAALAIGALIGLSYPGELWVRS